MRVLFLSQIVPYPPHGGVLQRGYHLLRELGRDTRLHLLAFVHPDVLPTGSTLDESRVALGKLCESVEYFRLWAKTSRFHRLAALGISAFSAEPFSLIAHRSAAFQSRVLELLATVPFDLIHVDTLALCQFVPPGRSIPAVLTHHNIEWMLMERRAQVERGLVGRRFLRREASKLRAYESMTSPAFDINVMVSREDEKILARRLPGVRTAVVPNGVDTEYFTPSEDPESPALVYAGGMNMFANRDAVMHFLTEIWPRVRANVPEVRFFAVGQDPPKELMALAARDPRIVVTGYVSDIRPLVKQAAVYVVPLRVGGGTRLKVLDAMAMGKALVSTSVGCEGIAVRSQEHLVIADDPESFASATVALLNGADRRRALGRAARALVERLYAWPVVAGLLRQAYNSALDVAGAPRV